MHPWRQRGGTRHDGPGRVARAAWVGRRPTAGRHRCGRATRERRAEATWKQLGRPRKRTPRAARCLFCLFRRFVSHASDMMVHAVRAIADTGGASRGASTAGRGKKAERSARHAATVAVLNRYDAFFAITAAARVLSLDTASPAPLALRTGVPWTEMGMVRRSRGRRVRLSPSVYGSLSRSLSRLAPIPALGRALGARRKRKVPFPELCEHRRHVPVKQLLDGLAPCLFKRSGGYERWEE